MQPTFDQSFMLMAGHIQLLTPFEKAFMVLKDALKPGRDAMLWGPEAVLMAKVLMNAVEEATRETARSFREQFDLSGDISLFDEEEARRLADRLSEEIKLAGPKVKNKVIAIATTMVERATAYEATLHDPDEQVIVVKILDSMVEDIIDSLPERVERALELAAEQNLAALTKLINNVVSKPALRNMDKLDIERNLNDLLKSVRGRMETLSDIDLGKMWSYTVLINMELDGVAVFISVAEMDNRTCDVCLRLHGKEIEIKTTLQSLAKYLKTPNNPPEFIGFEDVDNKPPEFFKGLGNAPPYHPRCRCSMIPLGVRATGEQRPPGMPAVIVQ